MILRRYRFLTLKYNLFIVFLFFIGTLSGQENNSDGLNVFQKKITQILGKTDSAKKQSVLRVEPDFLKKYLIQASMLFCL